MLDAGPEPVAPNSLTLCGFTCEVDLVLPAQHSDPSSPSWTRQCPESPSYYYHCLKPLPSPSPLSLHPPFPLSRQRASTSIGLLVDAALLGSGDAEDLLLEPLVGTVACAMHDQVVTQGLLLDTVDDNPRLDKVWYPMSDLAVVFSNASLEGLDGCLRISTNSADQDGEQHSSEARYVSEASIVRASPSTGC